MLTLFKLDVSFGPKAETVLFSWGRGVGGVEPYASGRLRPPLLTIPWRNELQPEPPIGALLDWRSTLSRFAGRTNELDDLHNWCDNAPTPSVRFISGEGGVGKTRLAAEFSESLRDEEWGAGFLHLRDADKFQAFAGQAKGNLLIVDYPESNPDAIEELFGDLAALAPQEAPIRILLLSREGSDIWLDRIDRSSAQTCFYPETLSLSPLGDSAPYQVFTTASERAAEIQETTPLPLSEEAFDAWLELAPENHRTLFIVALVVYGALHPDESVVTYTGPEVVTALARRELARFGKISLGLGLQADALARLSAMATIADGLESSAVKAFAIRSEDLELGIPSPGEIVSQLSSLGLLEDGMLSAVTPDILAAALVVEVFRQRKDIAPDWLWAAIEDDFSARVSTLGRLSYDAEVILGLRERTLDDIAEGKDDSTLSARLRDAVAGKPERCKMIESAVRDPRLEAGLLTAAVIVWRTLLESAPDEHRRADLWNNLSVHAGMLGNVSEALDAIREAVEIRRRLAASSPARYEPDLARSISVMSDRLEEQGQTKAAIEATGEALRLMRPYAEGYPDSEHGRLFQVMQQDLERLTGGKNPDRSGDSE